MQTAPRHKWGSRGLAWNSGASWGTQCSQPQPRACWGRASPDFGLVSLPPKQPQFCVSLPLPPDCTANVPPATDPSSYLGTDFQGFRLAESMGPRGCSSVPGRAMEMRKRGLDPPVLRPAGDMGDLPWKGARVVVSEHSAAGRQTGPRLSGGVSPRADPGCIPGQAVSAEPSLLTGQASE